MPLKLKDHIIEHYAFRSSDKCVKFEAIKQLLGGLYDWHPCTYENDAVSIFEYFECQSNNLIAGKKGYQKVETLHVYDYSDDTKKIKIKIHIFVQPRTHDDRRRLWMHAGILMKFPFKIGYCRAFLFPCEYYTDERYFFVYI